jgi:hypothetical protein
MSVGAVNYDALLANPALLPLSAGGKGGKTTPPNLRICRGPRSHAVVLDVFNDKLELY